MKKNVKLNTKALTELTNTSLAKLSKYNAVLFLLLLVIVYGFVLYKVSQMIGAQPSGSEVNSQVQAVATPHVDPATVKQMQALQDNSVSVHSLFDQARDNPFQE